jgi:hypothetical protein
MLLLSGTYHKTPENSCSEAVASLLSPLSFYSDTIIPILLLIFNAFREGFTGISILKFNFEEGDLSSDAGLLIKEFVSKM